MATYLTYREVIDWLKNHEITDDPTLCRELAKRFDTIPSLLGAEGTLEMVYYMISVDHPNPDEISYVMEDYLERFLKNVPA